MPSDHRRNLPQKLREPETQGGGRTGILIGLAGLAGCGKNTVAEMLAEVLSVAMVSFAEPMKRGLIAMFSDYVTEEMCFGSSDKRASEVSFGSTRFSVRHGLQTLGTEWGRKCLGDSVWLDLGMSTASSLAKYHDVVCITDVRYENEMRAIADQGGWLWHIVRESYDLDGKAVHASEADVVDVEGSPIRRLRTHVFRNTGSKDDLRRRMHEEARKIREILAAWAEPGRH